MNKLIQLKDIDKSFSGVQVLHGVNMTLNKGEVVCLVGENGAGKSTLIKIISGAENPDKGKIILEDSEYDRLQPKEAMEFGIATIYQDVDLVDTLTVADNIFQGAEILKNGIIVDSKKQELIAKEILDQLNMNIEPSVLVETLSPGQKQNLQIAKAFHKKAKVLIMDEPTSSLGEEEKKSLMNLVTKLRNDGIGIIYISHFLDEIFEIADKALILKDGYYIGTRQISETTQEQLIKDMVGRDASSFYEKMNHSQNDQALKIDNYSNGFIKDISFEVSTGEIFGLGGLVGAGRTEFVEMLFGAKPKVTGDVYLNNKNITPKNPRQAIKNGISFVTENRKEEGLFLERSVKENIAITKNDTSFLLDLSSEIKTVDEQVDALDIKVFDQSHEVGKLSGGNQQKVIISRWLAMDGDIFIFDEPTKGVDVGAREEIYKTMEYLAKQGKIIIMVSSSMPELMSMSDRIGIMRDGMLDIIVDSKSVSEDDLLKYYMGMVEEKVE